MRFWSVLAILTTALLASNPVAAKCSTLHQGWTWIIVQDGTEAVEYTVRSKNPDWQVQGIVHGGDFCPTCGQFLLSTPANPSPFTIRDFRESAARNGYELIGTYSVRLGSFKGEAQRITVRVSNQIINDTILLEATDGCANINLLLQDNRSLEHSPFREVKTITDATVVERIRRGPASEFDIKCLKSTTLDDFSTFKTWAGVEPAQRDNPPIVTPSHEEFMRGLQRLNQ